MNIKDNKKIMRACLVAHVYEEDLLKLKTDSPVCYCEAMCLEMLTASVMKWQVISHLCFCWVVCWKERYFLGHHLMYIL